MAKKITIKFRTRYVILGFLLTFFILGGVYLSQQTRMEAIADEKATLQTELDALTVEEERLDRMLEYMQTDEYLIQYCREKLGYVFADDIKFYEDENATSAAGGAASVVNTTPTPTPAGDDPTATDNPAGGSGDAIFIGSGSSASPDTATTPAP